MNKGLRLIPHHLHHLIASQVRKKDLMNKGLRRYLLLVALKADVVRKKDLMNKGLL